MGDQIALPLDWPRPSRPDGRFIPAPANRAALDHLSRWQQWPVPVTILTGPRRSGRSLLARRFVEQVEARLFDDAERHPEEDLFHAWNRALEEKRPLLIVAADTPPRWEVALPDLATRLAATPAVAIEDPDDRLFGDLLALHFADRGLHLGEEPRRYLLSRVERSYWNAEALVDQIDRFAIARHARITVPTIRAALEERDHAA